ncbi:MAG: FecR family protein, partial [Bdellovibrionota bacterium]
MKTRKFERSLLIAATLPLFICTGALAATPAGKITDAEGEAEIIRKGTAEPEIVQEQMDVFEGDALETGEDGMIRVALADGSSLTLAPEGHLKITRQLYDAKKGERESLFDLLRGKIRAEVAKLAKLSRSNFEVRTPTAVAGVRGTDFEVEHDEAAGESGVYVFEGSTDWKDVKSGESLLIQSGYFCRHRPGRKLLAALLSDDERARRRAFFVLRERAKRRRLRRI